VEIITLLPYMLEEDGTKVIQIKQNLKIAQDRHKIYAHKNRTPREFKIRDHVYL
jgi:hypothetical protein